MTKQVYIFATLSEKEIPYITKYLDPVKVKKDQILFKEGEVSEQITGAVSKSQIDAAIKKVV